MTEDSKIRRSSGNVFADVGLPPETLFKAELAHRIARLIDERELSQSEAAKILGVDQPKISALKRGKLKGFSIERLFQYLTALGQNVSVHIERSGKAEQPGSLTVRL